MQHSRSRKREVPVSDKVLEMKMEDREQAHYFTFVAALPRDVRKEVRRRARCQEGYPGSSWAPGTLRWAYRAAKDIAASFLNDMSLYGGDRKTQDAPAGGKKQSKAKQNRPKYGGWARSEVELAVSQYNTPHGSSSQAAGSSRAQESVAAGSGQQAASATSGDSGSQPASSGRGSGGWRGGYRGRGRSGRDSGRGSGRGRSQANA